MATEDFYEVEKIVDKRKSKKGRVEYLVRWRGYGSEGDTWEPESHLSTCMVYVHEFNRQQVQRQRNTTLLRSTRSYLCGSASRPHCGPPPDPSQPLTTGPNQTSEGRSSTLLNNLSHSSVSPMSAHLVGPTRRSLDFFKSGIKILVPKSPMNSHLDSEDSPSEAAHSLDVGARDAHTVAPEVALQQPTGFQLGPGEERARMGIRSRCPNTQATPRLPITPGAMCSLSGTGASGMMEALTAGRMSGPQSSVTVVTGATAKRRLEERCAFDKRLRFSVRQTESAYRYRDIVVKKQDGFTHIMLSTKSSENNALNPEVMKEIQSAMATAASDDSKLVLLGAIGSVFCCGLDFLRFIKCLTEDRKKESIKMAEIIRTFVNTFIQFRKPIVAAVNGPAVGLGAAILPLCDVVWANEKAWFQTPYTSYGQTPDACSSFTFPRIMGPPSANELLLSGRKLTAQEACSKGLVSQVLWTGTFAQEVMLRIKELVAVDSLVLRESKALVRNTSRSALEQTNERECEALKRIWGSSQGTDAILKHLQKKSELY
ncbi:chromodomain Y-like protein isoform X1 [Nerophis ophidion]|uniref:chromodomain Y-like protein isoform X1 n=1 Tax=Nerophis ophidion TaxID=159077 RepID=UPI002ADF1996|nr:chromodomain Y-like protein isoform X1 [Nerophis ophidion]